MAKKYGFNPLILMTMDEPQPTTVVGGATGQSTTEEYACSFTDWMNLFARDVNGDGATNFDDYKQWFQNMFADDHEEGEEVWESYGNDGTLFP